MFRDNDSHSHRDSLTPPLTGRNSTHSRSRNLTPLGKIQQERNHALLSDYDKRSNNSNVRKSQENRCYYQKTPDLQPPLLSTPRKSTSDENKLKNLNKLLINQFSPALKTNNLAFNQNQNQTPNKFDLDNNLSKRITNNCNCDLRTLDNLSDVNYIN